MTLFPAIPLLLALIGAAGPVHTSKWPSHLPAEPPADEEYHARPTLISEHSKLVPGRPNWIGVKFAIEDGWHTYWPGFNDSGFPAEFEFTTSAMAEIGQAVWPAPHRYPAEGGLLDHVFEHEVTVMFPVTLEAGSTATSVTIEATGDWLVCEVECVPEYAKLSLTLPIALAGSEPSPSEDAPAFSRARDRHAQPWPKDGSIQAIWTGDVLTLRANSATKLAFYPFADSRAPLDLLDVGEAEGRVLSIGFRQGDKPVKGVLEVWNETRDQSSVYQVHATP